MTTSGRSGGPLLRAAAVALVMTAALATILGMRSARLQAGTEITLTSSPPNADEAAVADVHSAFSVLTGSTAIAVHALSPARTALLADPDRFIGGGWVSLKPGREGRFEVMRVSASGLGPQPGEVVLKADFIRVSSEVGLEPQVLLTLPTLADVAPDSRAEALYQPDTPLGLVLSVTPDGRALLRRVVQGDVVLLEAPGLL